MRTVALYMPGEAEIDLLCLLEDEHDVSVSCVVDPTGASTGTLVAEAMGIPVHLSFRAARLPEGALLVGPEGAGRTAREAAALDGVALEFLSTDAFVLGLAPVDVAPEVPASPPPAAETRPAEPADDSRPPPQTETIDRTFARIEDVLDRDRLLPWLLNLAMDDVDADGGSLMLLDPQGGELFIAVARGLGDDVLYRTRVPLGAGVAGRVAASGIGEIVLSRDPDSLGDARGELAAALCVPLTSGKELLGVLNLCRSSGAPVFGADDLDGAEAVAHRTARILQRAEGVARTREGELRHRLARHLMSLAEEADDLETALAGWSGSLTMDLGAVGASLAVLREDGSLLVAESDSDGETRIGSTAQTHPAWNEVMDTGRPLIARQSAADGDSEICLYFLPVGHPRLNAVLGLTFGNAGDAHRFQRRSAAVVGLLERRLPGLLRRFRRKSQLRRQRDLLNCMTERNERCGEGDPSTELTALRVAAARVVGARRTYLVSQGRVLDESASPPEGWDAQDWTRRCLELLSVAGDGRWICAGIDPGRNDDPDGNVLVAPLAGEPASGMVLVGKERQDAGDSRVFNAFDADLAVRLAALISTAERSPAPAAPASGAPQAEDPTGDVLAQLRREMDRSDRYHVAFSVSAFRLPADATADHSIVAQRSVERLVRSSDTIHLLDDGVIVVVAPEETNSVSHLEQRVIDVMREAVGDPSAAVSHGRSLYPGPFQTPDQLLGRALHALDSD